MDLRRVLVLGSGGREHALAWRLARDPEPLEVLAAPGNDGIGRHFRRLELGVLDGPAIAARCREERIDLVVVGPEVPLGAGLADALEGAGVRVFGPTREAARLETSKWFAKQVMGEAGVPTARAESFTRLEAARAALDAFDPPWVLKTDGLAAGKGVLVTSERGAAEAFLTDCLEAGRFGGSGERVLIEAFLAGEEASVMAVCDGRDFLILPPARDYKRALDGDRGPNTGGMGAFAPSPAVGAAVEDAVGRRVVAPVLAAMARRNTPFRGLLYCGLMVGARDFAVLEFNVRFGDPEAQVVLPLLEGSLARLLDGAARGRLDAGAIGRGAGAAVAVALTDAGYPDPVRGQGRIVGLEAAAAEPGVLVFHAAGRDEPGAWRVEGGRAAYVVGVDATIAAARDRAYGAIAGLGGAGWRCRRDIAAGAGLAGTRGVAASAAGDAR